MIHYQLICSQDHPFDGWFRDSATFDSQAKSGLVACPSCGDSVVHRALMAPAIGRRRAPARTAPIVADAPAPPVATGSQPVVTGAVLPDQVRALLQRMRADVERTCEHVGTKFAEEARAIHNGESESRGIYGETTPEQAEALADDGIEIARIPWIPRADG